ncbi:hypothetical protein QFC20_006518 [Naganishia adeliensis]|uniref:Uncharacterized protein n=3 Tax=Naganishia adeliensis TaxID=92952 RepID=A0ACC2V6J4_9TREE|nr:hypothetical protein QFC20_006857 [Naganishia adeliensis]KAJ9096119.1 hypothetical protein QFC20_006494 [Naganishia adeliensis]KAJ9096142.1 hypothetical protein QFC20_006518 [Naganishia adeliensis]
MSSELTSIPPQSEPEDTSAESVMSEQNFDKVSRYVQSVLWDAHSVFAEGSRPTHKEALKTKDALANVKTQVDFLKTKDPLTDGQKETLNHMSKTIDDLQKSKLPSNRRS